MNELDTLLKSAQALLQRETAPSLCEVCWAMVDYNEVHQCDPDARAYALLRCTSPTYIDPHRRAKGYRV